MNQNEIKKEMLELIRQIEKHNYAYYVLAKPAVSDIEFDGLFDRLKEFEESYPELALDSSPTRKVGSDIDNRFPEVEHSIPVLSLDKVYSSEELLNWINKTEEKAEQPIEISIEPKIDGFSVVVYYEKGELVRAVSRGNGRVGNDITENIKTIRTIPLVLNEAIDLAVRGEVFIGKVKFEEYNKSMDGAYANPRNFAAGTIRRIKSSQVAKVPLEIYFYDAFSSEKDLVSHKNMLKFLEENYFPVAPGIRFFSSSPSTSGNYPEKKFEEVPADIEEMSAERSSLSYEIDGLVIKVNRFDIRDDLGYTSRFPRWAMAFKFESPQNISKVVGIDVQIGRTGKVTPLARIEPVSIAGTTVSRATLHNQDYINQLELGIGDKVRVSKRGEIIPAIEEVLEKEGDLFHIPKNCPECGSELINKGAHQFCPNSECPARLRGTLIYFVQSLDIKNLGKGTIDTLIEKGMAQKIEDLFTIDFEALQKLDGFGPKKIELLREGLEASKSSPFPLLLAALGLDEIGPKVVEILMENGFNSLEKITAAVKEEQSETFLDLHGIGEASAAAIIRHFSNPKVLNLLNFLKLQGFAMEEELSEKKEGIFTGTTWVITGSFENFKPRSRAGELIKEQGGTVASSISGKTTHLLAGEKAGSKLAKAEKVGAKVVSENEFMKILNKEEATQKVNGKESLF